MEPSCCGQFPNMSSCLTLENIGLMVSEVRQFRATVIGAGPAGLAAVGRLLDLNIHPILWIDDRFSAGRLSTYKCVPSNTKAKLFTAYGTKYKSFQTVWESSRYQALNELKELEPDKGCQLKYAANMVAELVSGLRGCPEYKGKLFAEEGRAKSLSYQSGVWKIKLEDDRQFESDQVVLATGSHPKDFQSSAESICLDAILQPDILSRKVCSSDCVAVIGSSHSAMLAIKIMAEMEGRPKRVLNFYRSPLKFAEYLPDGRIKHDNTGLKGEVAEWVCLHIKDCDVKSMQLDGFLERYNCGSGNEQALYAEHFPSCNKVVPAIGYERNLLPPIMIDGQSVVSELGYDDLGQLKDEVSGLLIPGLFGLGIAFPARVIDVDGTPELAVGLWKFIIHTDRVIDHLAKSK